MSYKIAVGSSDGVNVDLKFGEISKFLIYDIDDDIRFVGARKVDKRSLDNTNKADVSVNCNSFAIGEDLFLDFFHGEYTFDPKEEDEVFRALDNVAVIIDENLKGKLAIFLD
jgi:hypothetical protein